MLILECRLYEQRAAFVCVRVRVRARARALVLAALMYELCRFSSKTRNTVDELTARIRVPRDVLYNPVGSQNVMRPACNL